MQHRVHPTMVNNVGHLARVQEYPGSRQKGLRTQNGQALLISLLFLSACIPLALSILQRGQRQLQHLSLQRHLDREVMNRTREHTRVLNTVAAYNLGLKKLSEQATAAATYAMAVAACAAAASFVFVAPACVHEWSRLAPKLPGYFQRLARSGEIMAAYQDALIADLRQRFMRPEFSRDISTCLSFQVAHGGAPLQWSRQPWDTFDSGTLAGGHDVIHCQDQVLQSWEQVQAISQGPRLQAPSHVELHYQAQRTHHAITKRVYLKELLPRYQPPLIEGQQVYMFSGGTLKLCQSLHQTLQRMNTASYRAFSLPAPLMPSRQDAQGGRHYILLAHQRAPFAKWGVSTAEIAGFDAFNMGFRTQLAQTPSLGAIWRSFEMRCRGVGLTEHFPTRREFEHGLEH